MHSRIRSVLAVCGVAGVLVVAPLASSQNSSPVIQLLATARDARTRVQAALTLSRLRPPGAVQALERALGDEAPAVRAAAVQSLVSFNDPSVMPSLRAHSNDPDVDVRSGIARAIANLQSRGSSNGLTAGNTSVSNVRFVVQLGTLSNHASGRRDIVAVMRNAIVQEIARETEVALALDGALPPGTEARLRSGRARMYALEGSVNTLRRWTVATTLSVRAEVSLVLMAQPSRAIVGSLSGAATAQDHTPYYDADMFTQRLEDRALAAAVHGALGNLEQSLTTGR